MSDILKNIRMIKAMFDAMPPHAVAVWVVDRPEVVPKVKELLADVLTHENKEGLPSSIFGLPVIEWERRLKTEDELIELPPVIPDEVPFKDKLYMDLTIRPMQEILRKGGQKFLPWICGIPGVWIKMSDDSWRLVEGL